MMGPGAKMSGGGVFKFSDKVLMNPGATASPIRIPTTEAVKPINRCSPRNIQVTCDGLNPTALRSPISRYWLNDLPPNRIKDDHAQQQPAPRY